MKHNRIYLLHSQDALPPDNQRFLRVLLHVMDGAKLRLCGISGLLLLCLIIGCMPILRELCNTTPSILETHQDHLQLQEDPSCLSRAHQPKLRNHSRKLQIPVAFMREWGKYTELHARCTMDARRSGWNHVFSITSINASSDCRYLVYFDGVEGIGNRLLSLASAFAYALATSRVLLIDTRRGLHKLLCEPFPSSSWVLPADFLDTARGGLRYATTDKIISLDVLLNSRSNSTPVLLNVRHTWGPSESQMLCKNTHALLMEVQWLFWLSNLYIVPNLFLLPAFWQKWAPIISQVDQMFALISHFVIQPSNEVWALVLQEYRHYFMGAKATVGVQIRSFDYGMASFGDHIVQSIMDCLINASYVPRAASEMQSQATLWAALNGRNIMEHGQTEADVNVFIASLQGHYYKRMRERYGYVPGTVAGKSVRVHSLSQLQHQDASPLQAKLALTEALLLSYCDHLATSAYSTFGYLAHSWGNILPLILDFANLKNTPRKGALCTRPSYSTDPCLHTTQTPHCLQGHNISLALSREHRQWLHNHLHSCQDHSDDAWQLIQQHPKPQPIFALEASYG